MRPDRALAGTADLATAAVTLAAHLDLCIVQPHGNDARPLRHATHAVDCGRQRHQAAVQQRRRLPAPGRAGAVLSLVIYRASGKAKD